MIWKYFFFKKNRFIWNIFFRILPPKHTVNDERELLLFYFFEKTIYQIQIYCIELWWNGYQDDAKPRRDTASVTHDSNNYSIYISKMINQSTKWLRRSDRNEIDEMKRSRLVGCLNAQFDARAASLAKLARWPSDVAIDYIPNSFRSKYGFDVYLFVVWLILLAYVDLRPVW